MQPISERRAQHDQVSIYHWLPIADNMLPDILLNLRNSSLPCKVLNPLHRTDAITYSAQFSFRGAIYPLHGKINQHGSPQIVLELPTVSGMPLTAMLNEAIPDLRLQVARLLFAMVPLAVRNKLAVLFEGIVSFQSFESNVFAPPIDAPAMKLLEENHLISTIGLDPQHEEDLRTGFVAQAIRLQVDAETEFEVEHEAGRADVTTFISKDEKCFLFPLGKRPYGRKRHYSIV